jgi:AcrR family transcriptional regulator
MPRPRSFERETVVDAVLDRFRGGSYAATSTEDLCACTGLSRSSLYNTFHSKSEAYLAALERYTELKSDAQRAILAAEGTGRELVERLLRDTIAAQFATADRRACAVLAAAVEIGDRDAQVAERARRDLAAYAQVLTLLIERGQADGSITASQPAEQLARMLHAMINGLQVSGRVASDDRAIQRTIDTALQLL